MKINRLFTTTTATFTLALSTTAHAASVIWGAPTTISGDSDVSTAGTFLGAVNWGVNPSSTTINGVTFTGASGTGAGSSGIFSWNSGAGGSNFGTSGHAGLSTSYQDLFRSNITPAASLRTLTMSGLTLGTTYQFQWWSDENGFAFTDAAGGRAIATAGNSVTLDSNTTDAPGGLGQSVLGTFIANAATQDIVFTAPVTTSGGSGVVNGFQLRDLSTPPVPEPGTALFGLGLCGVAGLRRRR